MLSTTLIIALAASTISEISAPDAQTAPDLSTTTELRLHHEPVMPSAGFVSAAASNVQLGMIDDFETAAPFGAEGTWRFQLQAGGGIDPRNTHNRTGYGGIGVSYFFADNISLDLELNGAYYEQPGSNTGGGNIGLLLRWHIISERTWSMYIDGGGSVLLTADRVPRSGTRFNFLTQVGGGFSLEIASDLRLMTGLRWQHISNASLGSSNPGRDHLIGYAMLSVPF